MTVTITWPTAQTVEVTDAIRGAIGRDVYFYGVTLSGCPTCALDPVTNTATDSFCPTCSGRYWIPIYDVTTVSGHITWGGSDGLGWEAGGQIWNGECRLQIKYTDANLALVKHVHENQANSDSYILVDSKVMEIKNTTLRGFQQLNRIILELKEKEK